MREEGDRSAVACVTRITALNISFISGPSNYRIPRTCGARKGRLRSRLHTRVLHPAVVAAAITRGVAPSVVNETHPRSCFFPFLFSFFVLFRFTSVFGLRVFLRSFFLFYQDFLSIGETILIFYTSTEIAACLFVDRVSREMNLRDSEEIAAAARGRSSAAFRSGVRLWVVFG